MNDIQLGRRCHLPIDQLLAELPVVNGNWPCNGHDNQPIYFAVCDHSYFSMHAEALIASIDIFSPNSRLHLHLYDADNNQFDQLGKLQQQYPHVKVSYTWEETDLLDVDKDKRVIYFQSARFIRVYSALKSLRCPIVTIDIDSLIRGPIEKIHEAAGDADIGLFLRPEQSHPGKNVLASTVYAAPTGASLLFLENVIKRIAVHLLAAVQTEMLDQRCLWKSYVTRSKDLNVWKIPQKFSDWNLADDSVIWHGKGHRKDSDKFVQERDKLLVLQNHSARLRAQ